MIRAGIQGAGEKLFAPLLRRLAADRQETALAEVEHRPWPLPQESWLMGQTWESLLFAHWRVDEQQLRRVVPTQLPLDSHDGSAWLGVTPFLVRLLRLRGTSPAPRLSRFCELNVRTYVTLGGKPGIYFLSLDAASQAAVSSARRVYRLPYFRSRASIERDGSVTYRSERVSGDGPPAAFEGRYRPAGERFTAAAGTLEHFLTERYCLYTLDAEGRVLRGEIHHPPWPLRRAELELGRNTMAEPFGLGLRGEPVCHFAGRQDVAIWPLRPA